MKSPFAVHSTKPRSLDGQHVSTAQELADAIQAARDKIQPARLTLIASILSTVNVQSLHTQDETMSVAHRAVALADAALAEMER